MSERKKYMAKKIIISVVFFLAAVIVILGFQKNKKRDTGVFPQLFQETLLDQIGTTFFIFPYYVCHQEYRKETSFLVRAVTDVFPLYGYAFEEANRESDDLIVQMQKENEKETEKYRQEQDRIWEEGNTKENPDQKLDGEAVEKENEKAEGKNGEEQKEDQEIEPGEGIEENEEIQAEQKENQQMQEAELTEQAQIQEISDFVPVSEPVNPYDFSEEWNRERLISHFFAIDQNTALPEQYTDLDCLLHRDMSIQTESEEPQILIYHTHSQEAFADSIPGDPSTTIVGAGEKLANLLRGYGFQVMHHLGEYDVDKRDYAYNNSLPEIEKILEENPSIEVIIDLHRDEMDEDTRLVTEIQGKPTARLMFFNGMSYLKGKGEIPYLENPYIADNLAFSFQAQVAANEYYPGLTRRIYLKAYRYNMHLRPKSMLIELGAQNNTVEEIMNACDPLAHIISIVLKG